MEIVQISPSAYQLRDSRSSTSVGFIVTPDGVILIDTGSTSEMAAAIRHSIAQVTDQPIAYAINTHGGELANGNRHFEIPIIAHQACYQAMERARAAQERELARLPEAARQADLPALPTVSFSEDGYLYVGGLLIELLHAPGRSEGSLAVHLPDEHVLFVGDNLAVDAYPLVSGGVDAIRWMETLVRLRGLAPTAVVASRGRPATIADIDRQLEHLEALIAGAQQLAARRGPRLSELAAQELELPEPAAMMKANR